MRYYLVKNSISRNYIVVQHGYRGISTEILGVRYVDGYGVVAKDSKEYKQLKQVRMAIVAEFPITYLRNVRSVINLKQIETIWGKDVYRYFKAQEEQEAEQVEVEDLLKDPEMPIEKQIEILEDNKDLTLKCKAITKKGNECSNLALVGSEYCQFHIHKDERCAKLLEGKNRKEVGALTQQFISTLQEVSRE
jgi:hypothetical protein